MLELFVPVERQLVRYYRFSRGLYLRGQTRGALLVMRRQMIVGRSKIHFTADIGPGFIVYHAFCVGIGAGVKAGKNFRVSHNVTVGANRGSADGSSVPVIGDNVTLLPGSVVVGNITIGDNVIIGANCVVGKDVPSNSVVATRPARVVRSVTDEDMEFLCS